MRVLAVAAFVLAMTTTALAQPGMTQPTYGPTYAPPPPPPGAPAPQGTYYGGGYSGGYQPQWAQQPPRPQLDLELKSSGTAMLWAIGTTVAGIALIGKAFDEESGGLLLLGGALTLIGPSAGHIYAGESSHAVKASLLRAGGVVIFALGAAEAEDSYCDYDCYGESDDSGEAAMWIGGLIVVGSTLYDFYDAGRAVSRYNEKRRRMFDYQFSPTMMSKAGGGVTPGVGVTGTF